MHIGLKVFIALTFGPLLAVGALTALTMLLQWGADCESVRGSLECGKLLGLWHVNPDRLSFVGAGYALAFTGLWAAVGLAILAAVGVLFLILELGRSTN